VHEVNVGTVDGSHELWEIVQASLMHAPNVRGLPILGELPDVAEEHAVFPANASSSSGHRVRDRRSWRSFRAGAGISIWNGRASALEMLLVVD
jgi:hypothetical protein